MNTSNRLDAIFAGGYLLCGLIAGGVAVAMLAQSYWLTGLGWSGFAWLALQEAARCGLAWWRARQ